MNLKYIEYKALFIYTKRYLLLPIIIKCFLVVCLQYIEDVHISLFLIEITNILFVYIVVFILFDTVEEHAYLFMESKRSYFLKRLILGFFITSHTGMIGIVMYSFMVLLSSLSNRFIIVGLLVYFYLRVSESEFYALISEKMFFSNLFYVILLVLCMNLLTIILYVRKDMR